MTEPMKPQIDLLTAAGRQAVIDRFDADHQTTLDYHQQLNGLAERFRRSIDEVDWETDVAPVSNAALDHLLAAVRYANVVSSRQGDLDIELEAAGGVGDELDAEFVRIRTARRAAEPDETRLHALILDLGQRYRDEIVRQVFTPPTSQGDPMTETDDIFNGANGWFAEGTADRIRVALACNKTNEPWPAWSSREYAAVALALGDVDRLKAEGLHTLRDVLRYLNDGLSAPFQMSGEFRDFFAAARKRAGAGSFTATWNRLNKDQAWRND